MREKYCWLVEANRVKVMKSTAIYYVPSQKGGVIRSVPAHPGRPRCRAQGVRTNRRTVEACLGREGGRRRTCAVAVGLESPIVNGRGVLAN